MSNDFQKFFKSFRKIFFKEILNFYVKSFYKYVFMCYIKGSFNKTKLLDFQTAPDYLGTTEYSKG